MEKLHNKVNKAKKDFDRDMLEDYVHNDIKEAVTRNLDHSRVYCVQDKELEKGLIDINKSYGIVQEIRRRSN